MFKLKDDQLTKPVSNHWPVKLIFEPGGRTGLQESIQRLF